MKYLSFILLSFSLQAFELKTFETDYCTYFTNGTLKEPQLWKDCCESHDLDYWVGGSSKDQLNSDKRLKACIDSKGIKWVGTLMYQGVRLGHHSPVKSKYHWSWGWDLERRAKNLSLEEKKYILSRMGEVNASDDAKEKFIKERLELK
jgi:hypothetical protein